MNREAIIQWPNALVRVRGGSHADPPLFITCSAQEPQTSFEASWLTHPEFLQFLQANWRYERPATWNRDTFGNIQDKKNRIIAELERVQVQLGHGIADNLINIIHSLKKTLSKFSVMRRCFGDRNPSSFGSKVAIVTPLSSMPPRLSSANIIRLRCCQNDQGNWVEKGEDIKRMIVDF
ncbi:hypothetical protein V2J09_004127 [Rumex salicifolius]